MATTHHRVVHADFPRLLPTHLLALLGEICWNSARSRAQDPVLGLLFCTINQFSSTLQSPGKPATFLSARMTGCCKHLFTKIQSVSESEKHSAEKGWREGEERKEEVTINVHLTKTSVFVPEQLCSGQTGQWRCQEKTGVRGKGRAGVGEGHAGYDPHSCTFCLLSCHWQQIS